MGRSTGAAGAYRQKRRRRKFARSGLGETHFPLQNRIPYTFKSIFSRLRRAILLSMQSYNNIVIAFSKGKLPVHTIHNSRNEKTCFCRERNSKSAVLHHAMVIVYQYVLDFSIGSIGKVYLLRRLNCMIEKISRPSIQSGRLIRHT